MGKTTRDLISYIAENAITKRELVKYGTNANEVTPSDTAGEQCVGFADNDAAAGGTVAVAVDLISEGIASAAISKGDNVAAAGSGDLRTAVSGDVVIGIAQEAATALGDKIEVLIVSQYTLP